jgi:hypothetical protein
MDNNKPEYLLAWYMYPEPHGKAYSCEDLKSLNIVEEVFDYCQIFLAVIYQEGWKFLVETHGIHQLLAVNDVSGWFDNSTPQDAFDSLRYNCLISGYDPETRFMGKYDGEKGIFLPEQGGMYSILNGL